MKKYKFELLEEKNQLQIKLCEIEKKIFKTISKQIPLNSNIDDLRINYLLSYLDDRANDDDSGIIKNSNDSYSLEERAIVALPLSISLSLGFVTDVPWMLRLSTSGVMGKDDFNIKTDWYDVGRSVFGDRAKRNGAFLGDWRSGYRLSAPFYTLIKSIEQHNDICTKADRDVRLEAYSVVLTNLSNLTGERFEINSGALDDVKLYHATAFSLVDMAIDETNFDISPQLITKPNHTGSEYEDDELIIDETSERLLPNNYAKEFHKQFINQKNTSGTYLLGSKRYIYVDPNLRQILDIVREVRNSPLYERLEFFRNPRAGLKSRLDDIDSEYDVDSFFVETQAYSDRIISIGVWVPPSIPGELPKQQHWIPETFTIYDGETLITLKSDGIDQVEYLINQAIEKGEDQCVLPNGQTIYNPVELKRQIDEIIIRHPNITTPIKTKPGNDTENVQNELVLIPSSNINVSEYYRKIKARNFNPNNYKPNSLITELFSHQRKGVRWLSDAYGEGLPGVLLADDMGLGKTLQALTFLALLRENQVRGPILIIAPTGLLKNWEKEIAEHLIEEGLGIPKSLYGANKKKYVQKAPDGSQALNVDVLSKAGLILTTYETIRDYDKSIGKIPFACVVFDEIQKVKNPRSSLSRAAKTLNADFYIGLSGTPVENSMVDLWTVCDIVAPGSLGDLKLFRKTYPEDNVKKLRQLHQYLTQGQDGLPAFLLRRLKSECLQGLPERSFEFYREQMPEKQFNAYQQLINSHKSNDISMIELLQGLRSISLHPGLKEDKPYDEIVSASARFIALFKILDKIELNNEKALVFVEYRIAQPILAALIQKRYKLSRSPRIINGDINGINRQKLVDEFQNSADGFDVMLLSPKAGGVGLTLTKANHVVHLSRWWNPAVEDQCNDRVYRIGQKKPVTVHMPIAVHSVITGQTFDEVLNQLLESKRKVASDVFIANTIAEKDIVDGLGRASEKSNIFSLEDIDSLGPLGFED